MIGELFAPSQPAFKLIVGKLGIVFQALDVLGLE
jgi:hypothetical protein